MNINKRIISILLLTILTIVFSNKLTVLANPYEPSYDIVKEFDTLEEVAEELINEGYFVNGSGRFYDEDGNVLEYDVRELKIDRKNELETFNDIYIEGGKIELNDSNGRYTLYLNTEEKPERREEKREENKGKGLVDISMCVDVQEFDNLGSIINNSKYGFTKEDKEILDQRPIILESGYEHPDAVGFYRENSWSGYRLINNEENYTLCQLPGGNEKNPDFIITRDDPEKLFKLLDEMKGDMVYNYNLLNRKADENWSLLEFVGRGYINVYSSDKREGKDFSKMTDFIQYYGNIAQMNEANIYTEDAIKAITDMKKEEIKELIINPDINNLVVDAYRFTTLERCVNQQKFSIKWKDCLKDQTKYDRFFISIVEEEIPTIIPEEPMPKVPDKPKVMEAPKGSKEPNLLPRKEPKKPNLIFIRIIIIISIIFILYKIIFKLYKKPLVAVVSKMPFIPLFYHTRKISIYSNLFQEDGTIKRKKVFTEKYELNGTQLIIDITDTMNMKKEYNYLEIEVPKDIAHSVITKVVDNEKVKEIIPRTLIINHKNTDKPIQTTVISENIYNEKKNIFIIRLDI